MKPVTRVLALALAFFAGCAAAQTFPSKPVRLVVPFPAGGTSDAMSRAMGQELTRIWGQPVLVENRPGAGTLIGAEIGAKAPPDGHTILFVTIATMAINPSIYKALPYDPLKSFAPITILVDHSFALVGHPSVPAANLKELVALAKSKPGALNYGSFGAGSEPHLAMERFAQLAGINLAHVPYKGVAPVVTDLTAGTVQLAFLSASAAGLIRDGRARGFAFAGSARSPLMPALPTFVEEGYKFVVSTWWGLVAPAGTPRDIVNRIHKDVAAVITEPEFQAKRLRPFGMEPVGNTPEQFSAVIREEIETWQRVVKSANISVD